MPTHGNGNSVLKQLKPEARASVTSMGRPVELVQEMQLARAGEPSFHVYFVENGFLSILRESSTGSELEIGVLGREGVCGGWLSLGVKTAPFNVVVRCHGRALCLTADSFLQACGDFPDLRTATLMYCHHFTTMVTDNFHALAKLSIQSRLARWLLMASDHLDDDVLMITHETLSRMLGVRRPGVTVAIHLLEGERMVKSTRGRIDIIDREKLAAFAQGGQANPARSKFGREHRY